MNSRDEQYVTLRQKASAYCASAEHCEQEVRDKLAAWGAENDETVNAIITYLEENNFLSATRYCRAYAHDKLIYQGWGKRKIEMMLRQKHLPKQDIQEALDTIEGEQYQDILETLLQKKARSLKGETGDKAQMKLLRYAASRGFDYESSMQIIRKLFALHQVEHNL